ncbi:MAG: FMN-binding protein [Kiritimatiellaceae bacterium]|nr:FMN-binding protein [Kiritimatiellaceae bacterium]
MSSKPIIFWIVGLLLAGVARAETESDKFVRSVFGTVPEKQTLRLESETQAKIASMLGKRYSKKEVTYWEQNGRRIWVVDAQGKVSSIQTGFVVEQGQIAKSEVLVCKEDHGRQVRSARFLKQFTGLVINEKGQLNRRIDGLSGATISVYAVTGSAKLALYFDSLVAAQTSMDSASNNLASSSSP